MAFCAVGQGFLGNIDGNVHVDFSGSCHREADASDWAIRVYVQYPSLVSSANTKSSGKRGNIELPSLALFLAEILCVDVDGFYVVEFGPEFGGLEGFLETLSISEAIRYGFGKFVGGTFADGVRDFANPTFVPRHATLFAGDKAFLEDDAVRLLFLSAAMLTEEDAECPVVCLSCAVEPQLEHFPLRGGWERADFSTDKEIIVRSNAFTSKHPLCTGYLLLLCSRIRFRRRIGGILDLDDAWVFRAVLREVVDDVSRPLVFNSREQRDCSGRFPPFGILVCFRVLPEGS